MLEATPVHLPEGSLGLFRWTAKPKGTFSSLGAAVHLHRVSTSGLTSLQRWLCCDRLKQLPAHSLSSSPQHGSGWLHFLLVARGEKSDLTNQLYQGFLVVQIFHVNLAHQPVGPMSTPCLLPKSDTFFQAHSSPPPIPPWPLYRAQHLAQGKHHAWA